MDLNLVVLMGTLATDAEIRTFDSGTRLIRYLVVINTYEPRKRVDVVPVTLWDPDDDQVAAPGVKGDRAWFSGAVQRRYWEGTEGRRSRVEVVADQVTLRDIPDDLVPVDAEDVYEQAQQAGDVS